MGGMGGGTLTPPPFDAGPLPSDGGAFVWTPLVDNTNLDAFTHVRAFAPGDVWMTATVSPAAIEHFVFYAVDGGADVTVFTDDPFVDLELTRSPARVYATTATEVVWCDRTDGGCFNPGAWGTAFPADPGDTLGGLCTDGVRAYGVGRTAGGSGALFNLGATSFARKRIFLGTGPLFDCWVRADGVVIASGTGRLAYELADGGTYEVDVTAAGLSSPASIQWTAIHGAGFTTFISGSSNQLVEVGYDGTFTVAHSASQRLVSIAGVHPLELYAGGGTALARWNGATWSPAPPIAPRFRLLDLSAANANTYYAVGVDDGGAQLFRGRR